MTRPTIIHLVDDTTAGGVMRVLDHIMSSPALSQVAQHSLRCVDRKSVTLGRIKADVIVSHLAVSWRSMPMLLGLRALHPRTPLIHVEHSYTEHFVTENVTHKRRFATLLRTAYALFNRVVAVSHAQGHWLTQSGAVRSAKLTVIQSCVDLSAFRAISPVTGPVRLIGAIGRLDRQKGFDTLIEAFRRTTNPELALHIYGEGDEEAELQQLANGDVRIQFKGFAPDPVVAMASVDAIAMPSRWEAYGLVAIEALAARRTLLVSDLDGLMDHLPHGAQIVEHQSIASWQAKLEKLDPQSENISTAQQTSFETVFAEKWNDILSSVTSSTSQGWTVRKASKLLID